jgi:hypothetical protein
MGSIEMGDSGIDISARAEKRWQDKSIFSPSNLPPLQQKALHQVMKGFFDDDYDAKLFKLLGENTKPEVYRLALT